MHLVEARWRGYSQRPGQALRHLTRFRLDHHGHVFEYRHCPWRISTFENSERDWKNNEIGNNDQPKVIETQGTFSQ